MLGASSKPAHHQFEEVEFQSKGVSLSGTVMLPTRIMAAIVLILYENSLSQRCGCSVIVTPTSQLISRLNVCIH